MSKMEVENSDTLERKYYPNLRLYKLNQRQTQRYIRRILEKKEIPYQELEGNIYSFRFPGKPVFVAHMDTVRDADMQKPLVVNKQEISRKNGILGADDKAGVDILLQHIESINFCFTVDEESGCIGANRLILDNDFLAELKNCSCAIEYDRTNRTDMIEYCDVDLTADIKNLTHYKPASGLWTDISSWDDEIPGVNLSVGYYGHHSNRERLVIAEWRQAAATVPILNEELESSYRVLRYDYSGPVGWAGHNYDSADEYWDSYYDNNYGPYTSRSSSHYDDYGVKVCHNCGSRKSYTTHMYLDSDGMHVCAECLELFYGIKEA